MPENNPVFLLCMPETNYRNSLARILSLSNEVITIGEHTEITREFGRQVKCLLVGGASSGTIVNSAFSLIALVKPAVTVIIAAELLRSDISRLRSVGVSAVFSMLTPVSDIVLIVVDMLESHLSSFWIEDKKLTDFYWSPPGGTTLTKREFQILEMIAAGMTVKDIAKTLGLSPKTVDTHKYRIYRKIGVHTAAEAAAWFTGYVKK